MWRELFRFFSSLKLAVFSILLLASVLAVATFLESYFGMRAAHVAVYGTAWFGGVLFLLATNVLCAALSRFPWKKHQTGFVLTHLGIIILLFGSFVTQKFGIDGNLPVVEGQRANELILPDPELSIQEEASGMELGLEIPESVRTRRGKLLTVTLPESSMLELTQYVPRAQFDRQYVKSPMPGLGMAAVKVELHNERFKIEEWLTANDPSKASELNLGPAILSLERLWSEDGKREFFAGAKVMPKKQTKGTLVIGYQGREYRLNVSGGASGWRPLSDSGLEIEIYRYLPYATVEKNELVSKSPEPRNPAVQFKIRKRQGEPETHTAFAFFPEFPTFHRRRQKSEPLGVTVRFLAESGDPPSRMAAGHRRGRLRFAVDANGKKLLYSVSNASGKVHTAGTIETGNEVQTGWMDLKFKILEWFPDAVESLSPIPIEYISGGGDNYLSAIELSLSQKAREQDRFWLFEGTGKRIMVGGRGIDVSYTRRRMLLPFQIELEKFTIGTDPGTSKAASYESKVFVRDTQDSQNESSQLISMNHPLKHGKYTFYQASYQMEEGKAPVSIFSVNYDPGRPVKYLGSIVMVLGILLMFYMNPHYWNILWGKKG